MVRNLAIISLLLSTHVFAESKTYAVKPAGRSTTQFHAEDTYDSFDGKTNKVSGTIVADPAAPGGATVTLSVDLASLDTGVGLRNREMRERFLETSKFPHATFKSVSVAAPPSIAPNTPADIRVTGDFTLHGVTKRVTIPVRVVLIPDGNQIHATSMFNVRMPDFGIDVPDNILVTVNHEVPVRLDIWAAALK
jgi:polyisoprenoid-binding protein YceI